MRIKLAKDLKRHYRKEDTQMADKYIFFKMWDIRGPGR